MNQQISRPPTAAALVASVIPLYYFLASKVCAAMRAHGAGQGAAEAPELVNHAMVGLLESLHRFDPDRAQGTFCGFAHRIAWIAMRQYAWACHKGLSLREFLRQRDQQRRGKETPPQRQAVAFLEALPERAGERYRVYDLDVEDILVQLKEWDQEPLRAYIEPGGGDATAVRRRFRNGTMRLQKALDRARKAAGLPPFPKSKGKRFPTEADCRERRA